MADVTTTVHVRVTTYDPAQPTPALGGPLLLERSPVRDNRELEARADVLTFTGPPLAGALDAIGPVSADIRLRSSLADTDVFVRVWEKLETFRGEAAFGTWIHRVAINVMLARQDARRRERKRFEDDDKGAEAAVSKPREAESKIDFETALEALPPGARRVLVLHDVEGYKHHEIAEMLNVTVGTSKSQLHRARMLMRDQLVA